MKCPDCGSSRIDKRGFRYLADNTAIQRFECKECYVSFSEKINKESQTNRENSQLCVILQEAKKLESATEIKTVAGEKGRLVEYAWLETKRGISESTLKHRVFRLDVLRKRGADLDNPDSVLTVLMTENFTQASKFHYIQAYYSYAKAFNIPFEKPKIIYEPKQQYTPKPYEVQVLLQNLGRQQRALCSVMADTGARVGELSRLLWEDIDFQGQIIYINYPEKGSRARKIKVSENTISLLNRLPKKYKPNVFNPRKRTLQATFAKSRNRIAEKLQMQNLRKIHHHSFRRYFADQTYKKSKFNTRKVQAKLGHKHLTSTEKYFGDWDGENVTYETARAYTIEEEEELRQLGYDKFSEGLDENGKPVKLYSRMC